MMPIPKREDPWRFKQDIEDQGFVTAIMLDLSPGQLFKTQWPYEEGTIEGIDDVLAKDSVITLKNSSDVVRYDRYGQPMKIIPPFIRGIIFNPA